MNTCRFCRQKYSPALAGLFDENFCSFECKKSYEQNQEDLEKSKAPRSTYSPSSSGSGDWSGGCGCLLLAMILVGGISTFSQDPSKNIKGISEIVSPKVFIESYFKNIKNKDCKTSWNMLASKVQYTISYKSFDKWCKENTFEIKEIKLVEKYAALGIVAARVSIKPKRGNRRLIEYWYDVTPNSAYNGAEITKITEYIK
jgi:hypothetical protein